MKLVSYEKISSIRCMATTSAQKGRCVSRPREKQAKKRDNRLTKPPKTANVLANPEKSKLRKEITG